MENKKNTITLKINSKQFKEIPMERTYKEELDFAMEHKINVLKLNIADEVSEQLSDYWWVESELESNEKAINELFENICSKVCEVYLHLDNNYSLANVVEAVIKLCFDSKVVVNEITKYMVVNYFIDNF